MIGYFEDMLTTISESVRSIDDAVFEKLVSDCASTLRLGRKVVVSGLGKNVPICEKFVGSMNSLGMAASFLHTNSAIHGDMGMVKDDDLVIILTKSGDTTESVYLVDKLADRKINLWLLTFCEDSILTQRIPNSLIMYLRHEGDLWDIMPNNSTTINLIVLQALAMLTAKKMGLSLDDFRRNHPGGHIGEVLNAGNSHE